MENYLIRSTDHPSADEVNAKIEAFKTLHGSCEVYLNLYGHWGEYRVLSITADRVVYVKHGAHREMPYDDIQGFVTPWDDVANWFTLKGEK